MKKSTYLLILLPILVSCSTDGISIGLGLGTGIGSRGGIGTSVSVPLSKNKITQQELLQIDQIGAYASIYFDSDKKGNKVIKSPIDQGYVRAVFQQDEGRYLVQDFYQLEKPVRKTNPMWIPKSSLYVFDAHPQEGDVTVYDPSGDVKETRVYQDNKLVKTLK